MTFNKKIIQITQSDNHLVYVQTNEEERLENFLINANYKIFKNQLYCWDFIDGYKSTPESFSSCKQNPLEALNTIEKYSTKEDRIFFLKDFYIFLEDAAINRKVKNIYRWLKKNKKYIFISGINTNIPNNLQNYIYCTKLPLPNEEEIQKEIEYFFNCKDINISKYINTICKAYKGFSIKQIRTSLFQLIEHNYSLSELIKKIFKEKSKNFNNINGLKFYTNHNNYISLGGLNNLKKWLTVRKVALSHQANAYGIKTPKGILLVGIQGTGKSLSAYSVSKEWNLPLLKLDVGKIFASTLGESENRIEKVIEISHAMAPCILWIDEIEKIFTKDNNHNDSGTTRRVTSILLNWLSDKKDEVFIIGTANKINNLPIEMLRKGRFDEIFFVDLPNFKDRMNIFKLQIKRIRPITWNQYNLYYFSKISNGFSGAEIEQTIIDAMYIGFHDNREFTSQDVIIAIRSIIPISKTHNKEIKKMRAWGYSGKTQIA
uniref:Uncharacterized AAA domain-containing protein ycf46 n=1 Tax=Melanothamnus harveyi TaxID=397005 RepID=A0A1Z1MHU0_MELHR|nr:hypothetical protein [Melanothamnus harveyi]ARW65304.1 hypothetical protein [Melanothamnus harveyi]